MDARLTDDLDRMQDSVESYIEDNGGTDLARRRMDGDRDVVAEVWADLADLDVPAITVPIEHGGLGDGLVSLCAVLEVTGRVALPGPLVETAGVAAPLIAALGTPEQRERYLPAIAEGDATWSLAAYTDRNESLPEAIQLAAEPTDDGSTRLDGTATLVPYGGEVDQLLVAARSRTGAGWDGISLYCVDVTDPAVDMTELHSTDQVRPLYDITFDGIELPEAARLGPRHGAGSALQTAVDRFTLAACASLVGAGDRAVERSSQYGQEREQYGQPIGRFQAVKHRIVDMWMAVQSARSLVYYAAWAMDANEPDAGRAVAATKVYVADRLQTVFGDDIRTHGGMGFTWDHDGHIALKQATAWRNFLETPEDAADRVIDARVSELE